jgi:hypothetical protein
MLHLIARYPLLGSPPSPPPRSCLVPMGLRPARMSTGESSPAVAGMAPSREESLDVQPDCFPPRGHEPFPSPAQALPDRRGGRRPDNVPRVPLPVGGKTIPLA